MIELTQAVNGMQYSVLLQAKPTLEQLLGEALVFFGLSLIVWGAFGQGKVTGPSAGVVSLIAGAAAFVWAVVFLFPKSSAAALVVAAYGLVFMSAGGHTFTGTDLEGHGVLNFAMAGVTVIVGIYYTITVPTYLLALAVWTYVLVLIGFGGGAYFGTDGWLRYFTYISYFVGIVSTGLYGTLLMLGYVGFTF